MLIIFGRFAYNIFHRGVDASQANLLKRHAFIETKVNILLSFVILVVYNIHFHALYSLCRDNIKRITLIKRITYHLLVVNITTWM